MSMLKLFTVFAVLGASLAQVEQGAVCQSSQLQQFQFCLRDFALDIDIFWNHNGVTVDFVYEATGDDGWRAIGWSSGGAGFSMFPSNVVVGCLPNLVNDINTPIPGDYEIFGGRAQGVGIPAAQMQNLQNLNQQVVNGICTVSFTRPVDAQLNASRGHDEAQILNDQFVRTIAAGGGDELGQHPRDMRTRFDVNYQQGLGAASTLSSSVTIVIAIVSSAVVSLLQ